MRKRANSMYSKAVVTQTPIRFPREMKEGLRPSNGNIIGW